MGLSSDARQTERHVVPKAALMNALAKAGIELGENGSIYPRPKGKPVSQSRPKPLRSPWGFFLSDAEGDDQMEPDHGQAYNRKAKSDVEQRREPPRVGFIRVSLWGRRNSKGCLP